MGVTNTQEVMGVKGQTILSNVKKQGIQVIQGKQKNGYPVQLVSESFIQSLIVLHVCKVGENVEIDGVVYFGVTNSKEVMGVKGHTILSSAKKQEIQMIQGKQKKNRGASIQLVPESFIKSLVKSYECEI